MIPIKEFEKDWSLDRMFSMEQLEGCAENKNGILVFKQCHPWSNRYGPTSLLHVTLFTRACYSHVRLPEKLSRWGGDEQELDGVSKFGNLASYSQYSKHLDNICIEDRMIDYDEKEYNLQDRTFKFRISHDTYDTNRIPYMMLKPEYVDRSKRLIFL